MSHRSLIPSLTGSEHQVQGVWDSFSAYHIRSSTFLRPKLRVWLSCLSQNRETSILTKMFKRLNHRRHVTYHGGKIAFPTQIIRVLLLLASEGPSMRVAYL